MHRIENAFRKLATLLVAIVLAASTGCTAIQGYYVMEDAPPVGYADLSPLPTRPSVKAHLHFQSNGSTSDRISSRYTRDFERVLRESGLFSEVRSSGPPADAELTVVMNNLRGGVGGAVAQGLMSGLTFGLIGTRVTDEYVFEAHYERPNGPPLTRSSQRALVSTSGLIKKGVSEVPNRGSVDRALAVMLEQEVLGLLREIGEEGAL